MQTLIAESGMLNYTSNALTHISGQEGDYFPKNVLCLGGVSQSCNLVKTINTIIY